MTVVFRTGLLPTALLIIALLEMPSMAQNTFVYINNNNYFMANTISGYSVAPDGSVTQLEGSPFPTGGEGQGANGYISANRITTCSKFLYASNDDSGNVSGFSVNSQSGDLVSVPGSPFATGGPTEWGISVSVSPDCKFLFVAYPDAFELFAFSIQTNGSLLAVAGSPFSVPSDNPEGTALSRNGTLLAVALPHIGYVGMFSVQSNGALEAVPGSPFRLTFNAGAPGGMQFDCDSSRLFVPEIYDHVDVFSVAANGALSLISDSPFSSPAEDYVAGLTPNGRFLLTSDGSAGVNTFHASLNGTLNAIGDFSADLRGASGLSIAASGKFVYLSDFLENEFSVMTIASDGTLQVGEGSPVSTNQDGGPFSLIAYPPMTCATLTAKP